MGLLKDFDFHLGYLLKENRQVWDPVNRSELEEEFLCCCERARHAIKEFTNQGDDGKVSDCFAVAGDALCDLQWCLEKLYSGVELIPDSLEIGFWKGAFLTIFPFSRGRQRVTIFPFSRVHECFFYMGHDPEFSYRCDAYVPPYVKIKHLQRALCPLLEVLWLKHDFHPQSRQTSLLQRFYKIDRVFFRSRKAVGPSDSAHLPPGLNVDDLGEIEYLSPPLGDGTQGTVYKARWGCHSAQRGGVYKDRRQLVAVKEVFSGTRSEGLEALHSLDMSSGGSLSRSNLYSELDVLKTLNHPNIVELKGYTRKPAGAGKYGLVMELMKCSLQHLIKSEKLTDLVKVDTLLQVARGMHFLHAVAGIMHRDLKPANILIRELNHLPSNARRIGYVVAKLADFGLSKGLSKHVDEADRHTYMLGTTFYMAPELRKPCRDDSDSAMYAKSADIFSFGTTCFNVLAGEEQPCPNFNEFYERIKRQDVDEWLQKCGASQLMRLLVGQCWCPHPNSRPPFNKICRILEEEKRRMLEERSHYVGEADLLPILSHLKV